MNNYFSFDRTRFDYWPLYETIKKYYPIGFEPRRDDELALYDYFDKQGGWALIADNMIVPENYRNRWGNWQKQLAAVLKKRVYAENQMSAPSFSGYIPVRKEKGKSITYTQELFFSISLLGPYFTIYGIDQSLVYLPESFGGFSPEDDKALLLRYPATHTVTVSPYQDYKQLFLRLEQEIRQRFPDYRFVPFDISLKLIRKLAIDSIRPERESSVFECLFNSLHDFQGLHFPTIRGDTYYGADEWRVPN